MKKQILLLSLLPLMNAAWAQRVLPLGQGIVGSFGVYDMVGYNGQLIIGGAFAEFNGHARRNLQGWSGTDHFDYPGAFTAAPERVRALEVFNGALVAAGNEADFGHVARWDGSAWQSMGDGLSASALALCAFNGDLYAASSDSLVSHWDGSAWQAVGDAFNGVVRALEAHNGELYAAGSFDHNADNSVELRHLAKWSGSAWEEVNYGLGGDVNDLLSTAGGLVVAGGFTTRGDGAQTFPLWTIYEAGSFAEPADVVPDATTIEGISAHPDGGFLLGGTGSYALWIGTDDVRKVRFGTLRSAIKYHGQVILGGQGGSSYTPVNKIGRLVEGTDEAVLDAGGIAATVTPTTALFGDLWNNGPGFEVPAGTDVHTVFSASPWVVGEHMGTLHSASPSYAQSEVYDTLPTAGPNANLMDEAFYERYFQVWKVDQGMIADHQAHWNDVGYEMPYSIATWPGNGETGNGEPARIAPFHDLNGDGVYEPELGESPRIRGDQAVYQILHSVPDFDDLHPGMRLDLGVMHYAYADAGAADTYNTVFTNYRIINRGTEDYTDVRFGAFADLDIGNGQDDYAGCDSVQGMFYGYNGDAEDDSGSGSMGYGSNIPAQGVLFLNEPMSAHRVFSEQLGSLEDAINGTTNGAPFMDPGYPTHFQYPGGTWSEVVSGHIPGPRLSIGSIGPYALPAGDTLCVDLAFPFARAASGDPQASLAELITRADALHDWYDVQNVGCGSVQDIATTTTPAATDAEWGVFPNPAQDQVTIRVGSDGSDATLRVLDAAGRVLRSVRVTSSSMSIGLESQAPGLYFVELTGKTQRRVLPLLIAR